MTNLSSYKDLVVWQVNMDLVDVCFDVVEAIHHPYALLLKGIQLTDPVGKMLHGLVESLETRDERGGNS